MAKRKRPPNQELDNFHEMPRRFKPKNEAQSRLWDVIGQNTVTICLGPAGSAKTYVATSWAVNAVEEGHYHRIVMTRPVVEATESLGFLPGDIASKVQPYMRPMTDTVAKIKAKEPVIDTIPLAFMRGITLENCVGLLDEAQNCNVAQLKLYLTRLGDNAKLIISGDTDQVDVNDSGLLQVAERLRGLNGVAVFEFTKADIVRHPLVGAMLDRF
jgi:phosphate starvation-inducible PhoH-like protein